MSRTETLKGRGQLVGPGINTSVLYELSVITEKIDAGHLDNPAAPIDEFKLIEGRVQHSDSIHPPPGEELTLTLEDERKLFVFLEGNGRVRAIGGFFQGTAEN